jgi:uncharacterized protein
VLTEDEPDPFEEILESILPYATSTAKRSKIHGPTHWRRVADFGRLICDETGADSHTIYLFAALHDACRENDRRDPDHGRRAAKLAKELRGVAFETTDLQQEDLEFALKLHADGYLGAPEEDGPTVSACWDADRLDMRRTGRKVKPKFLTLPASKVMCPGY